MLIRKLANLVGSARDVYASTWNSRRLLLRSDGMGFSLHDTLIHAGTETNMWYQNHLEAVYCIEGEGELVDLATGETHAIGAGTLYALDRHDRHLLRAKTALRMVCVFNPPLTGHEVHDAEGSYPLVESVDQAVADE
jgi:L-ectoine synthase